MVESLSKNVTRQGMTSTTLNYLRVRLSSAACFRESSHPPDWCFTPSLCSCVSSWSRCRSWCPGTRRTRSTPGTASKPRSSRSGRRWSRRQVKKDRRAERQTWTQLGNMVDIGHAWDVTKVSRKNDKGTAILPKMLSRKCNAQFLLLLPCWVFHRVLYNVSQCFGVNLPLIHTVLTSIWCKTCSLHTWEMRFGYLIGRKEEKSSCLLHVLWSFLQFLVEVQLPVYKFACKYLFHVQWEI